MDIQLPDADGVTLLGELRGDPRYGGVAVIAVTAHALHGDNERLIAAGFDGVITKPLATRTFCAEVARCVRQRRRR
jgi:two-component system cell cycle response regulator